MLRGLTAAVIAATVFSLLLAPAVLGHAELLSADPGPNDTVKGSPARLVAQFSQDLNPSRTSLEVRSSASERIANGGKPGSNKREFVLSLPGLDPGEYEVRWTSYSSEDGELARGSYSFTVTAVPTPSPTPSTRPSAVSSSGPSPTPVPSPTTASPTASATPSPSAAPADPSTDAGSVVIPIMVALLVVVVLAGWMLRGRRT